MTKTTILLCGPPVSAIGGGPTNVINMLASPLKERYRLIHFESGSRGAESPAKDEGAVAMLSRLIFSPFALAWRIVRVRPAIVHLNTALNHKGFWRDLVYLLVSKLLRRKVIVQCHGGSIDTLCANRWMQRVARAAFSVPDAVVVLASSEIREFTKLGTTKCLVKIPNGIDVSEYHGSVERVHSGRVQRLAYVGRLVRTKGIFEAMEAIEILRTEARFHDIELRIAGSGPAKEEIERYIIDHSLGSCVRLVGPKFGRDKVRFFKEADVFLFPSYEEGLPYAILESLAAGTPIIASRVGGIPDVVIDGIHGILINPKDPSEIVRAVHTLGQSQEALRVMSKNCADWASEELGLDRLACRFEELYEKVSS